MKIIAGLLFSIGLWSSMRGEPDKAVQEALEQVKQAQGDGRVIYGDIAAYLFNVAGEMTPDGHETMQVLVCDLYPSFAAQHPSDAYSMRTALFTVLDNWSNSTAQLLAAQLAQLSNDMPKAHAYCASIGKCTKAEQNCLRELLLSIGEETADPAYAVSYLSFLRKEKRYADLQRLFNAYMTKLPNFAVDHARGLLDVYNAIPLGHSDLSHTLRAHICYTRAMLYAQLMPAYPKKKKDLGIIDRLQAQLALVVAKGGIDTSQRGQLHWMMSTLALKKRDHQNALSIARKGCALYGGAQTKQAQQFERMIDVCLALDVAQKGHPAFQGVVGRRYKEYEDDFRAMLQADPLAYLWKRNWSFDQRLAVYIHPEATPFGIRAQFLLTDPAFSDLE